MAHATIRTPAGPFTFVAQGSTVLAAGFTDDVTTLSTPAGHTDADIDGITKAVTAYFNGDLTAIDAVDVAEDGGEFHARARRELRAVTPGAPVTYTQLAQRAGRPGAVRAAANACATNGIALFVPCHRVVRTDGALGGYRWGLQVKEFLLRHERKNTETRS